jgi:hypothetical protein
MHAGDWEIATSRPASVMQVITNVVKIEYFSHEEATKVQLKWGEWQNVNMQTFAAYNRKLHRAI